MVLIKNKAKAPIWVPRIESIYFQSWVVPAGICILRPQSVFTERVLISKVQPQLRILRLHSAPLPCKAHSSSFLPIYEHYTSLPPELPGAEKAEGICWTQNIFAMYMYFIFLLPLTNTMKCLSERSSFLMGVKHYFFSSFNLDSLQTCSQKC